MKQCRRCKLTLGIEAFAPRNGRSNASSYCRDCRRAFCREYYARNVDTIAIRRTINQAKYRARNRKYVTEYLLSHPCVDCGESDVRVLDFDHVRSEKFNDVSNLVSQGWRWERIAIEIAKCEVRCANCHRKKTRRQFEWPDRGGT